MRVLFVCHGNTCRSPMAAALAALRFPGWVVAESAGTHAPARRPATPHAREVVRRRGGDLTSHRSRPLRRVRLRDFDLIVALSREAEIWLRLESKQPGRRVQVWEVDDPIGGPLEAYEACAAVLEGHLAAFEEGLFARPPGQEPAPGAQG